MICCKLFIHDLNFMRNRKNTLTKIAKFFFCNILTFCKAFDSISDFLNLGYQVKMIYLFKRESMFA